MSSFYKDISQKQIARFLLSMVFFLEGKHLLHVENPDAIIEELTAISGYPDLKTMLIEFLNLPNP